VLEVVVGKRAADLIDTDVPEPGRVQNFAIRVRRRQREHATGPEGVAAGRRVPGLEKSANEQRQPRIPVRRPPYRVREPAAVAQDTPCLAHHLRRLGGEHHTEPREHGVDARVRQLDGLGVHDTELDVAKTAGFGTPPGCVDHARRDVRGDEATVGADTLGGEEAGLARPGGQLEDRLARPGMDLLDEPVGYRARAFEEVRAVAFPRLRQELFVLDRLRLIRLGHAENANE
jgi:hypothetical protein